MRRERARERRKRISVGKNYFSWFVLLLACTATAEVSSFTTTTNNPYTSGCLYHSLPGWNKKRVCNSDDQSSAHNAGLCREPVIPQLEIRIYGFNWDTSYFEAWLLQILLSELLDVPVTIESGHPDVFVSMYDPNGKFEFKSDSNAIRTSAFSNAVKYQQDCTKANRDTTGNNDYEPCAHHFPEIWNYNQADESWIATGLEENSLEFPYSLGMVGLDGIYVTKYTVQQEPSILSYFGMIGEENRWKLAKLFPTPFTWGEYCTSVSTNNCTKADEVANRPPATEQERNQFYKEGQYTGHFQHTPDNDCIINPFTCTGHLAPYPCGWSSYAESLMYHHNIALKGGGRDPNMLNRGYHYSELVELFYAANATKSNLIIEWWTPNQQSEMLRGTDFELVKVVFPYPTRECLSSRHSLDDVCSPNQAVRVGDPIAACDDPPTALVQTVTTGLNKILLQQDDAIRSPAYEVLKRFLITEFKLSEIFQLLKNSTLTPRDAVCQWAVDNFYSFLIPLVPPSHPRTLQDTTQPIWIWICISLGLLACTVVLVTAFKVYQQRNERVIRYAQIEFLWILLFGGLTLAIGAIVVAAPPSNGTCIVSTWLVNVGYTLILVPLIIKVGAINRLSEASKRMTRVTISRSSLLGVTALVSASILIFLGIWTGLDAPTKTAEYELTDQISEPSQASDSDSDSDSDSLDASEDDYNEFTRNTIVNVSYYCSSESPVWNYIGVAWNAILLVACTVLAIQTRSVRQEFNESQVLGLLIYGHFVIALLLLVTFFLSSLMSVSTLTKIRSILYSLDTLTTIIIYFIPKLLADSPFFARTTLSVKNFFSGPPPATHFVPPTSIDDKRPSYAREENRNSISSAAVTNEEVKGPVPLQSSLQSDDDNKQDLSDVAVQIKIDRDLIEHVVSESNVSTESEEMLRSFLSNMETLRKDYASLKERAKAE